MSLNPSFPVPLAVILLLVKKIKQYLTTAQLYDKKIPAMMEVQKLLKYLIVSNDL